MEKTSQMEKHSLPIWQQNSLAVPQNKNAQRFLSPLLSAHRIFDRSLRIYVGFSRSLFSAIAAMIENSNRILSSDMRPLKLSRPDHLFENFGRFLTA